MSNMFYNEEDLEKFKYELASGQMDNGTKADTMRQCDFDSNYPENANDLKLNYDANKERTIASYQGENLFSVTNDGAVYFDNSVASPKLPEDMNPEIEIEHDDGSVEYIHEGVTSEDQAQIAKDFCDFHNAYAGAIQEHDTKMEQQMSGDVAHETQDEPEEEQSRGMRM